MNSHTLVSHAVDLAVTRNPRLVLEPYYQMKAAATILAEAMLKLRGPHLLTASNGEQGFCGGRGLCEYCDDPTKAEL